MSPDKRKSLDKILDKGKGEEWGVFFHTAQREQGERGGGGKEDNKNRLSWLEIRGNWPLSHKKKRATGEKCIINLGNLGRVEGRKRNSWGDEGKHQTKRRNNGPKIKKRKRLMRFLGEMAPALEDGAGLRPEKKGGDSSQ